MGDNYEEASVKWHPGFYSAAELELKIRNLMETMKWTAEQAMEAIKVPVDDRGRYAGRL